MGGLLGRAKALIGQPAHAGPPAAAPFALRCGCGAKLEGLRRREAQTLACRECGGALFILPVDPLPPLAGKPKRAKDPKRAADPPDPAARTPAADPEDAGDERPAPPEPSERPPKKSGPPALLAQAWKRPEDDADALPAPRRPFPKKTVGAALALLALLAGGGFALRQRHFAELARELPEHARTGLAAFQRGQYDEARAALAPAVAALDTGAQHPDAAAIRQGHAEAAALAELLGEPLDEALAGAVALPGEFRRLAGRSVLVDLQLVPAKGGRWTAEWLELVEGKPVKVDAQPVAALGVLPPDLPVRCLAAVRFGKLEKTGERWTLSCQPGGGALLTDPRALDLLGLTGDPKAAAALESQRQLLGLPPLAAGGQP